ncbi:sigma-70 family RNA polymerase sigma factor [Leucobacter soli]|uniref:sigma-70 family RNA polymerase sigma factor n=1 Tax=Leucobacter soli TaxID=2812850 RepID=UPI00361FC3DD
MDPRDDAELCEIVRTGSESRAGKVAFAELYRRHRDTAMAQAYRITGDRGRAEDLVAETFVRVLRALAGGNGPRDSVLGYVLVSLRSEAIRVAKLEEPVAAMEPDILAGLMEHTPDFSEGLSEGDQVRRAFAALPDPGRRAVWLLDVEELSIEEAADHLDMTSGALRVLAFRTRKRLGTAYLQQYVQIADEACAGTAGRLAEYLRGSLGVRSERDVSEHLESCPHCTEQIRRLRSLGEQLRAWIGPVVGEVLSADLRSRASVTHPRPMRRWHREVRAATRVQGSRRPAARRPGRGWRSPRGSRFSLRGCSCCCRRTGHLCPRRWAPGLLRRSSRLRTTGSTTVPGAATRSHRTPTRKSRMTRRRIRRGTR